MVVYNLVWTWLTLTVEDLTVAQEGLRLNVGIYLGFFFSNNDMVGSQDSEWL